MDPSPHPTPIPWADLAVPPPGRPAPVFDVFTAASALDDATVGAFLARVDGFAPVGAAVHPLAGSAAPVPLPEVPPLGTERRSVRTFADDALDGADLARLLEVARTDAAGRRSWPSAGGLAAVEVHLVALRVAAPWGGSVHRFGSDGHALAPVAPSPDEAEVRRLFSLVDEVPPVLVVIGALPAPTLARYGERGGRFVLMEVGAAAQALSWRLTEVGLAGYLLGGLLDAPVTELLGATGTGYQPFLALACGRPSVGTRPRRRGRRQGRRRPGRGVTGG